MRMTVERWAGNGGQMAGTKQQKQDTGTDPQKRRGAGKKTDPKGITTLREAAGLKGKAQLVGAAK